MAIEKETFVNPYNFIPLMNQCERSLPEIKKGDCYTGYFECNINVLTPLFIPNTSSSTRLLTNDERKEEQWRGYDFYSYENLSNQISEGEGLPAPPFNPVIPGSEIRGAVRSVYEAAFNGCMSSVSENRMLSRRSNEAKKPGILKKKDGIWYLYPCKKAMIYIENDKSHNYQNEEKMGIMVPKKEYNAWKEGQEIWIKTNDYYKSINSRSISIGQKVIEYKILENENIGEESSCFDYLRKKYKKEGFIKGWLHKGEEFGNKHHESVFYEMDLENKKNLKVEEADISRLHQLLKEYADSKKNQKIEKDKSWYGNYEVSSKGTMVYYSKSENGNIYLSPACIGKEVFIKTIGTLLKNNGGYEPCTGEELCSACKIFGMLDKSEKNNSFAYGSKVRIGDGELIISKENPKPIFGKPIILPELGEPKPSTVEFYTKSPYNKEVLKNKYWTYDYKYKYENNIIKREMLSEKQPKLRGRKYYWHSSVKLKDYEECGDNQVNAMRQRVRPILPSESSNNVFHFRVYFERLSKQELCQLKWALDFGNSKCAHKIGRAKPLGFGSVKIIVKKTYLRNINNVTGEWITENPDLIEFFDFPISENEALKTVQLMANWEKKPENVKYPLGNGGKGKKSSNDSASHQWFTLNRGSISKPNFKNVLPEPEDEIADGECKGKKLFMLRKNGFNNK